MSHVIIPILYNIRSAHNVGSILRTCDGFGVHEVIICGYTPYPQQIDDKRLPHIAERAHKRISKTALGAEKSLIIHRFETIDSALAYASQRGMTLVALEQAPRAIPLMKATIVNDTALLLGEEVQGVAPSLLDQCEMIVEVPMKGTKESFNVSVATAIALYQFCVLQ